MFIFTVCLPGGLDDMKFLIFVASFRSVVPSRIRANTRMALIIFEDLIIDVTKVSSTFLRQVSYPKVS